MGIGSALKNIAEMLVENTMVKDVAAQATEEILERSNKIPTIGLNNMQDLYRRTSLYGADAELKARHGEELITGFSHDIKNLNHEKFVSRELRRQGLEITEGSLVGIHPVVHLIEKDGEVIKKFAGNLRQSAKEFADQTGGTLKSIDNFDADRIGIPLENWIISPSFIAGDVHPSLGQMGVALRQADLHLRAMSKHTDNLIDKSSSRLKSGAEIFNLLENPSLIPASKSAAEGVGIAGNLLKFYREKIGTGLKNLGYDIKGEFGLADFAPHMFMAKWVAKKADGTVEEGFETLFGALDFLRHLPQEQKGLYEITSGGLGNVLDYQRGIRTKVDRALKGSKAVMRVDKNSIIGMDFIVGKTNIHKLPVSPGGDTAVPFFSNLLKRTEDGLQGFEKDIWKVLKPYARKANRFLIGAELQGEFVKHARHINNAIQRTQNAPLERHLKQMIKAKNIIFDSHEHFLQRADTFVEKVQLKAINTNSPLRHAAPLLGTRPFTKLMAGMKDFVNFTVLNLRALPAVLNISQPMMTLWPFANSSDLFRAYSMVLNPGKKGEAVRAFLNRAGISDPKSVGAVAGEITSETLQKIGKFSPFSLASDMNRRVGYLTGVMTGARRGLNESGRHQLGLTYMVKTEFMSTIGDVQPLLRDPLAAGIFQYKAFFGKNLENVGRIFGALADSKFKDKEALQALAKWTTATMAVGGAGVVLPGGMAYGLAKNARAWLFGEDKDSEILKSIATNNKGIQNVILNGLPTVVGMNLVNNANWLMPWGATAQEKLTNFFTSPITTMIGTGFASIDLFRKGDIDGLTRRLRAMNPLVNQFVALEELARGDTALRTTISGTKIANNRGVPKFLFGFLGVKSDESIKYNVFNNYIQEMTKERSIMQRKMAEAARAGEWQSYVDMQDKWDAKHDLFPISPTGVKQIRRKIVEYQDLTAFERFQKKDAERQFLLAFLGEEPVS